MDKLNAFIGRFVGDLGASVHTGMVVIGERLGLYKALAASPLLGLLSSRNGEDLVDLVLGAPLPLAGLPPDLFSLPAEARDDQDDPWWGYSVAQARDAEELLNAVRRPFGSERLCCLRHRTAR